MTNVKTFPDPKLDAKTSGKQTIVMAGGCFWCVEAVYKQLKGVLEVTSGYAGGTPETANYRAVCSGRTNHAEAVQICFDARKISLGQLLKVFFSVAHDPTQLNGQGNDIGRQYRSAIFYSDLEQKQIAAAYMKQLDDAHVFDGPIVTTLEPLEKFYPAEDYHQDYAELNPDQPYIACAALPKVDKLRKNFAPLLKG